jgi:AAA+ superfamily predicted ATPase
MLPNFGLKDLRGRISDHFGKDPANFAIVTESLEAYNHPNLQLAMDKFIASGSRRATVIGIQGGALNFMGTAMADIVSPKSVVSMVGFGGAKEGPVQYTKIAIDYDKSLPCVDAALYLIEDETKLAVLCRKNANPFGKGDGLQVEVLCEQRQAGEEFLSYLRSAISKNNVYRGKILSIERNESVIESAGSTGIKFHTMAPVKREQIILPEGLLARIERQTIEAFKYSDALRRAKRKLKRGILLHGSPGTGKSLTAMYLASALEDRTALIVTGRALGLIESTCKLARWLQPAMVVIEDVDLIAEDRTIQRGSCSLPILFELMNQMDGLTEDSDVLFVLTTNRPETLEPALASRPGRIDQAYEIPLPDSDCRRRLFDLYSDGLVMEVDNMPNFIKRTSGASGAFIAELVRKAALFAAPDSDPIVVKDQHLDEAMHELLFVGGSLTKSLLGFRDIGFTPSDSALSVRQNT